MSAALAIVLAALCLAGGGLLGFLLGRGGGSDKRRAEALEHEFEDYKRNVTEHFGKTAEHFQSIGRQYRELYEHMASGATTLCEEDDRTRLAFPSLLTIEAVAETESAAEPALGAAPEAAGDATDAAPAGEATEAEAAEAAVTEQADDAATEPDAETREAAEAAAEDVEVEVEVEVTEVEEDAAELAADGESDDDLKVEVSVEMVDDEGETGTEAPAPVIGAAPLAETTDLDPTDDAGATRH